MKLELHQKIYSLLLEKEYFRGEKVSQDKEKILIFLESVKYVIFGKGDDFRGCLKFLKNLEELEIYSCEYKDLSDELSFKSNITTLTLGGNIRVLPDLSYHLETLKELHIVGNELIRKLPAEYSHLKELESVNISGSRIEAVPEWWFSRRKIRRMDLNEIPLSSSFLGITNMTNLEILHISECKLGGLGLKVSFPQSLMKLYMDRNGLGDGFDCLLGSEVYSLSIRFNGFTKIPSWLSMAENIEEIDLEGNRIHCLPDWLLDLENLKAINLSGNNIDAKSENYMKLKEKGVYTFL